MEEQQETQTLTLPTIPCCLCGALIAPNGANMCLQCVRAEVDITDDIMRNGTIVQCKKCSRWLIRNDHWVPHEWESRELLAACLKKIGGLSRYKLVDAKFLYTEPHSKRIKVRVVIQREVLDGHLNVQQTADVEFVIQNRQCNDCIVQNSAHVWRAVVQVRQRVHTKRSLAFLEQTVIAQNMHRNLLDIENVPDGLDFYFSDKSHAQHFTQFLSSTFPVRTHTAKKLVGADLKSNTHTHQFSTLVELVPLCKDDLVVVPRALTPGRRPSLLLVTKLSSTIHLIDPVTLEQIEISATKFFRNPFVALISHPRLVPFVVLDVETNESSRFGTRTDVFPGNSDIRHTGGVLAEAVVAREADLGSNDRTCNVNTHLGHVLHAGDTVLGYDLAGANLDVEVMSEITYEPPDVILVRKVFPDKKKNKKGRRRRVGDDGVSVTATEVDTLMDPDWEDEVADLPDNETALVVEESEANAESDMTLAPVDNVSSVASVNT